MAESPSTSSVSGSSGSVQGEKIGLKKELGLLNGVAIIVGCIVGSGIFVSPKGVLQEAGSVGASLIIWTLCGVISFFGAMCYAELGTSILESGSDYAYIRKAFGGLPSFLYLWVALVCIIPCGNAIAGLTFANYVLQPVFPTCEIPDSASRLLAALTITLLTLINCWNVKWAARVQDVFTVTKVLALIIIIIAGIVRLAMGKTENLQNTFENSASQPGAFALAFYSGMFSYAGWNYLNFVTEELKNPYKNLPRAIWISMPMVTAIYVLANIAYFAVLTPQEMLDSSAVAVTFSNRMLGVMSWIMPVFVACSTFGALNGAIFTSSRLFFVGAREGHLPDAIAMINLKHCTPLPSLLFVCIMSLVMLCTSDVYTLINYATFVESAFITFSVCGLLYLRKALPDLYRPIKVHLFFPIFFLLVCFLMLVLPLFYSPIECLAGVGITLTGVPVYLLGVAWTSKPRSFTVRYKALTVKLQKLLLCVREEPKFD